MLAALAVGFASCSEELATGPENGGVAALSFKIEKPVDPFVVTRAPGDIALTNEWSLHSLDVYAAVNGGVSKLILDTDYTLAPAFDPAVREYTVTMGPDWLVANAGETANFYFVGNNAQSMKGAHSSLTTTTETAFENALTNALGVTSGKLENFTKPTAPTNPPTAANKGLLFSTVAKDVPITGTASIPAQLARREARFDVYNTNALNADPVKKFVITDIIITNAANRALIFSTGNPATVAGSITKTNFHQVGTLADAAYTAKNDEADLANNVAEAAFYLHPVTMGGAPAANAQIVIMGRFGAAGEVKPYPVPMVTAEDIKANHRYRITLNATVPDDVTATLELIDEMEEGGDLPVADVSKNSAAAVLTNAANTNYDSTKKLYVVQGEATNSLTITAKSDFGTQHKITYQGADAVGPYNNAITVTKATAFGATRAFKTTDTYTITVPAGKFAADAVVTIDSKTGDPADNHVIRIRKMWGGDASKMLYIDGDGKLAAGAWGDQITTINQMAFFKFGSIIGFNNIGAWNNSTSITFNPTALVGGTDITSYAGGAWNNVNSNLNDGGANKNVPGYNKNDWDAGYRNISGADYNTYANFKKGKGDPCMLVGQDPAAIRSWTEAQWNTAMGAATLRLPTVYENQAFVGGPATMPAKEGTEVAANYRELFWKEWTPVAQHGLSYINYNYRLAEGWAGDTNTISPKGSNYKDSYEVKSGNLADPNLGKFPVEVTPENAVRSQIMPAAGYRYYTNGAITVQGTYGWSSTPYSESNGHYLYFYSNGVWPVNDCAYSYGFTVRCVAR